MTRTDPGVSYRFVPIVRQGFRPTDTAFELHRAKDSQIAGPLTAPVELTVEAKRIESESWEPQDEDPVSNDVRLYGPGDVEGINHDQVVRVEPEPNTEDFPPNYFPLVEFASPELPWLLSPEYTSDDLSQYARNRPWIALVVVDREEASVTAEGPGNLPVLEAPASELPPPSETWAWAHAQVVGEEGTLMEAFDGESGRTVSRLLCPRNLHRQDGENGPTEYVAAVVPTFEPGRRAGLGREPYPDSSGQSQGGTESQSTVDLAWPASGEGTHRLPVYYMWEFQVGSRDFETLVDEFEPHQLSTADIGARDVDVTNPGPEELIPTDPAEQTIDQVGALKSPAADVEGYAKRSTLVEDCLNQPHRLSNGSNQPEDATDKPVVGAPLYGQWYVDADAIDGSHEWFADLNGEPAYRIAAGFGAEVVRENQEAFVGDAWDQVGELEELNRVLRGGQLSRATSNRIYGSLEDDVLTDGDRDLGRLLQFTQPLQGRLPDIQPGVEQISRSLKQKLREEVSFPSSVLTPAYRRLTSPRGPLVRNAAVSTGQSPRPPGTRLTPTAFASEFVEGRTTPADLREELDPRVVSLGDMRPATAQPLRALAGQLGDDAPWLRRTRVEAEFGVQTVDPDAPPSVLFQSPDGGTPASASAVAVTESEPAGANLPNDLLKIHRLGNWARSLADEPLTPGAIREADPSDEVAFVLRKVDAQLQSSIEHTNRALESLRTAIDAVAADADSDDHPASDGGSPASPGAGVGALNAVETRLGAVRTNAFDPLDRTLDNVLSLRPANVPAVVETDKDEFVRALYDHHEAAMDSLATVRSGLRGREPEGPVGEPDVEFDRPGVDPNTGSPDFGPENPWLSKVQAHLLELLDRTERLRGAVNYGSGVLQPPAEIDDGDVGRGPLVQDPRSVLDLLDPELTIPEKVLARVNLGGGSGSGETADRARTDGNGTALRSRDDPLEPVRWAPTFDRPMFEPLKNLSEQYLLPGVDDIPRKSIGAVATNPAFVESYLAGANHEFTRELLWRRFPTGRRGTYFQNFWNDRGNPSSESGPDIDPLVDWENRALGGNIGTPDVVLVLRGELLRQFPNTTIYMARAEWTDKGLRRAKVSEATHITEARVEDASEDDSDDLEHRIKFPMFRGSLDPDITFLGFDLSPPDALGGDLPEDVTELAEMDPADRPDPGWFFVFEEAMGETRFGLDAGDGSSESEAPMGVHRSKTGDTVSVDVDEVGEGAEVAWNGLSWDHVATEESPNPTHVSIWQSPPGGEQDPTADSIDESQTWRITEDQVTNELEPTVGALKPDVESSAAVWGRNSAHMARITFQRPVRMTVHADDLLEQEAESDAW